jgi:hypothetical protein
LEGEQKKMQHGETGAALPRNLARQRGKAVCDAHNSALPTWINRLTGKPLDRTGTFVVESRTPKGKRQIKPQD